jgi:CHAT domain-containing protein
VLEHRIALGSGDSLSAVVEQRGIDVRVLTRSPDGEALARFDSPNHRDGPEAVSLVAERAGEYVLEIESIDPLAPPGEIEVRIREIRPATAADRHRALALAAKLDLLPMLRSSDSQDMARVTGLLERSVAHWRAAGDVAGEAQAQGELAFAHSRAGNGQEALTAARASLTGRRQGADRRQEVLAQGLVAAIYTRLGEPQKALDYHRWGLETSRLASDPLSRADSLLEIGTLRTSLGQPEAAIPVLRRALALWTRLEHPERRVRALNRLGDAYAAAGDHAQALRLFRRAAAIGRAIACYDGDLDAQLKTGVSLLALGRPEEAERAVRRGLAVARRRDVLSMEVRALLLLAQVRHARGETREALALYEQTLGRAQLLGSADGRGTVLLAVAALELESGRLLAALEAIERALEQLEAVRGGAGDRRLAAGLVAGRRGYHELHQEILIRLHERQPLAGWDRRAFEAHEQARARGLLEALGETRAELAREVSPELAERELRLLERLRESGSGETAPEHIDLLAEYQEVRARIRRLGEGSEALAGAPSVLGLRQVQERVLDRDTLLLEYSLAEPRSILYAVSRDRLSVFSLPGREEIERDARALLELLLARGRPLEFETRQAHAARARRSEVRVDEIAGKLSATLLAPAAHLLGSRRLLVVGDGALQVLPWSALPVPSAEGTGAPLIAQYALVQAPSASVIAALRERERSAVPSRTLAVVADPVFAAPADDLRRRLTGWLGGRRGAEVSERDRLWQGPLVRSLQALGEESFPPLPGTRAEAEAILALVPRERRLAALGHRADRDAVLAGALDDYRILHFATHGVVNTEHPDLSGIVLSLVDRSGEPLNGFLRLYDVYRLRLSADLVVLSACRTALGREVRGEGLDGLVRGFFHAGAPLVVASLWDADDRATAELMVRFYRGMLQDGLPPVEALRRAQLSLWRQERWRSPYYWAGFVPQGDWRAGS